MANANGDAQPPQRGFSREASDLLRRIGELQQLDRLRKEAPRRSTEYEELVRRIEQKAREVLEVVKVPRVTVGPKAGGGWQVSGQSQDYLTQEEAVQAARNQLINAGGGELVVTRSDGRIRQQDTIGRPDPRESKG
jgi:hypothetical protein